MQSGARRFASALAVQLSRDCRFGDGMALPWLDLDSRELRLAALSGMEATLAAACRRKPAASSCMAAQLVRTVAAAHTRVRGLRSALQRQLEEAAAPPPAGEGSPLADTTGTPLRSPAQRLEAVLRGVRVVPVTVEHLFWR